MGTLSSLGTQYVGERFRRGELTRQSARNKHYTLRTLDQSFGNRPIEALTQRAVERWLESVGHLAPATRRAHLSNVRGFCQWLLDRKAISRDPTERIATVRQPRSVPRALSSEDVGRVLRVLPDSRAHAIVMLMVGCGLRCVEVSRLSVQDYDRDGMTVSVVGKGGHGRVVPVPAWAGVAVDRYLEDTGVVAGPLIRSRNNPQSSLAADTISGYVSEWMNDAGVKARARDGRSAHAFRHTCASDVLDACHDLRVVQEMLGHQHLSSTAIYLRRANLGQMREAMEGRIYRPAA